MEIAAWVICRTSTQAATHSSDAQQMSINFIYVHYKSVAKEVMAHLCLRQEDVRTSPHALYAGHQEL